MFVTLSIGAFGVSFPRRCECLLVCVVVSIMTASGLLWLSELIEEHTKIAKTVGKKCIYVRPVQTNP